MGFWEEYFWKPIETGEGYNIVNTAVFAVVLIISLFIIIRIFRKLKIKMNRGLWYDLLPFVFLGGVIRALEDAALLPHHWIFITPGIYFLIFTIAFGCILVQWKTKKPVVRVVGAGLLAIFGLYALLHGKNWTAFAITTAAALGITAALYYVFRFFKNKLLAGENWQVLFAHVLDATASYMAVSFLCVGSSHYIEQHVVPSALFGFLPVIAFIPIKIAVILTALYVIDSESKGDWNWLLKFTVLVLGLGPGVRNAVSALINSSFC